MALLVPASRRGTRQRSFSGRPSNTWGTVVTASGTPHALTGTKTTLIAATTYEAEWIRLIFCNTFIAATVTDGLVNIYIGAAGSEVLLIDSLMAGWADSVLNAEVPLAYWFPVRVPRGARISAEYRALIASDTVGIMVELGVSNGEHWVGSGVETLGEVTASSKGTAITAGSSSEGSYASIGTTGRRYRYVIPGVMSNNDISLVSGSYAMDFGVGSASYQAMDDWMVQGSGNEVWQNWVDQGFWCDIPSGTALQLRGQCSGTPSGAMTAAIYGVY